MALIQTADLLFQKRLGEGGEAILASRKEAHETMQFNHVALFISEHELIHALDPQGVELIAFDELLKSGHDTLIMRIQGLNISTANSAVDQALNYVGTPYDAYFEGHKFGFYCSSLIQHIFPQYFEQQAMTFKDKNNGHFHPHWIKHYEKAGKPIPEGALGTHPMGLIQSECLLKINV